MKKLNLKAKIFLFLASISGILWVGSYMTRLMLAYQIFEGVDFTLRPYVNGQNLQAIFIILNSSVILTTLLYAAFILFFGLFLLTSKLSLKKNGWLFIICLIIIITLPLEAYLISIDYKIYLLSVSGAFNPSDVLSLYIKRFKVLSSFPVIEILSYFAILFFGIFQPLKKD